MANLLTLPVETQLEIYQNLNNIDDALHLARVCKLLNNVFETPPNRLNILRCIIQNAPQHKNDLQLHESEACFAAFVDNFDNLRVPSDHRRPFYPGLTIVSSETTTLSAGIVWSIVCRWHAMKFLFDLYCDSTIRPEFLRSMIPYVADGLPQTNRWKINVAYEVPLSLPSCQDLESLRASEKQRAYERFYRALCSHWRLLNRIWALRISRYWTPEAKSAVFAQSWKSWVDDSTRESLQEKFEAIEVIDYVWDFLARKTFPNPDRLSAWLRGDMEMQELQDPPESAADNWLYFFHTTKHYLRPPHIIELLNHVWNPGRRALEQPAYVHSLGLFYFPGEVHPEGVQNDNGVFMIQEPPGIFFLFNWIELAGIYRLLDTSTGELWKHYRYRHWVNDLRGRVLFSPEPDDRLLERIRKLEK
ncbi:hypothetical protein UA08_07021 [Talaromyces atroroseus]|uniref:F-box domain-containing protein n=1 Tax=Talaromyces atroroseus TaxID=1441469 RepID=A0A225AHV5_TALAT|nr:hypothetical protein UA08_07021 [Talaromyces atroroseus]OKL57794.1 hypothetical protein UA08_07021 [Talaromyces atroroseus]